MDNVLIEFCDKIGLKFEKSYNIEDILDLVVKNWNNFNEIKRKEIARIALKYFYLKDITTYKG